MNLNKTAPNGRRETCVKAKETKSLSTGFLAKNEEDHVIHSDAAGPT